MRIGRDANNPCAAIDARNSDACPAVDTAQATADADGAAASTDNWRGASR
jgi:hypothetical protein